MADGQSVADVNKSIEDIRYRPMVASDVGRVPEDCHGSRDALLGRIEDLGAAAMLVLLEHFLDWAASREIACVVAKFTPADRAVMGFMGGQPATAYTARGFEVVSSWVDQQLSTAVVERRIVSADSDPDVVARVGVCVKALES